MHNFKPTSGFELPPELVVRAKELFKDHPRVLQTLINSPIDVLGHMKNAVKAITAEEFFSLLDESDLVDPLESRLKEAKEQREIIKQVSANIELYLARQSREI